MRKKAVTAGAVVASLAIAGAAFFSTSDGCPSMATPVDFDDEGALIAEHMYGGQPEGIELLVRHAYVTSYDAEHKIPKFSAFHVIPEYLDGPPREGQFSIFRQDPDIEDEATDSDYTKSGYDRGHLAPYNISGGDRDGDSLSAEDDPDDELTVKQINYLTNIAPQHENLNRNSGLWYDLERYIQDDVVAKNCHEVWVIAGALFEEEEAIEFIGKGENKDVAVPHGFYQILIMRPDPEQEAVVLAFKFGHPQTNSGDFIDFLASIDEIETAAGIDFFPDSEFGINEDVEGNDTSVYLSSFPEQ